MKMNNKVAKIFTIEQQFPCGPQSSCCGPIGQNKEEVTALKNAIEKLGLEVETYYVQKLEDLEKHPQVLKLFRTFGIKAIPVIILDDEIVCMGRSDVTEIVTFIKNKL